MQLKNPTHMKRRTFLRLLVGAGAAALLRPAMGLGGDRMVVTRPIPSSGEQIPVIGMGS